MSLSQRRRDPEQHSRSVGPYTKPRPMHTTTRRDYSLSLSQKACIAPRCPNPPERVARGKASIIQFERALTHGKPAGPIFFRRAKRRTLPSTQAAAQKLPRTL